ncbi:MAG TPA: ExeM/NucH family extracellular endonuclease, partial [Euzebyales bacterium]|nr:ExeM/NucH family extracellular endonuclease [Euzebyales bacterium]
GRALIGVTLTLALLVAGTAASAATDPVLNEFVANHTGTDTAEFAEIAGDPSTDYSAFTVVEIEGDGTTAGVVDGVLTVGTTSADGYWATALLADEFENGTVSLLLVEGFTGAAGDDLDTDNDGTLDATPWARLVDAVAVSDGGGTDRAYGGVTLDPAFDGGTFTVGGASRIPDRADTDAAADWTRNDFDGAGLPDFPGTLVPGEARNTPGAANTTEPDGGGGGELGACGGEATAIHAVQGTGATSPSSGDTVVVEAVVVGDFQNNDQPDDGELNGVDLQEEDAQADSDAATSEGVFVFAPGADDVATGDVVRVLAEVTEFQTSAGASSLTELAQPDDLAVCGQADLPTAATVELPVASADDFERYEGMRAVFPQDLQISEYFNYDRFGEVVLALPFDEWDRVPTPTAVVEPGAEATALADAIALRRITLDDGLSDENPDTMRHPDGDEFTLDNRFRGGDTVSGVTGVIDDTFGLYRIQPTDGATHTEDNPRPAAPEPVGGDITVSSFNVLNYFLTIDRGQDDCGPARDQECRGADTTEELQRQRAKILAALSAIDADVFGLIEMENTTGVEPLADLVAGLNDAAGADVYDFVDTGTIGTDAIRVGIIYKPGSATPVGDPAILDATVDPRFRDDLNRPALAQTFSDGAGGVFTVAVNHLKSKGTACDDVGDPDTGDGQGNCNITRTLAAQALVDWLATDPTVSGDGDALIIGDLNSYDKEDPIDAVLAGPDDAAGTADDYTDLVRRFEGEQAYSYVFDGLTGYLDHALSNATMTRQVTGATTWHINADEPDLLDYDTTFKSPAQDALYAPDPYRSSDHDPVIVGLDLDPAPVCEDAFAWPPLLFPPNHRFVPVDIRGIRDRGRGRVDVTVDSIFQDEAVDARGSGNTAPDGRGVGTDTAHVRAERVAGGNGRVYHIAFTATDAAGGSCTGVVRVGVPGRLGRIVDDGPRFDSTVRP